MPMETARNFFNDDREYFKTCKPSISAQNGGMLTDGCAVYAAVLIFYTALTAATEQPRMLLNMYFCFDAFHLLFCAAVALRPKAWKANFAVTQAFCLVLEMSLLCFFALEGALVSREQHSLYVPIAIILAQLLFVHRAATALSINFVYVVTFAALSRAYKIPSAYTNDFYVAIATLISSCAGYFLIANTRHNEGAALRKFEALSKMDPLTGVYNKTTFEGMLKSALDSGQPCALIIIDIDRFSDINARYGFEAGDEVLKAVGFAVRKSFREDDITGRFGADRFMALMCPCSDESAARERVEYFDSQSRLLSFSVPGLGVKCASGIAVSREGDDVYSIFARARHALNKAKSDAGRAEA